MQINIHKMEHDVRTKSGFTLIELSIVLVIIGLLIGGILVGQDMIKTASNRAGIGQIETYKSAVNTFRLKYNCIPGDCADAVAQGLGTSGGIGANSNGNGLVEGGNASGLNGGNWQCGGTEAANFWYHLMRAGLIGDKVTGKTNCVADFTTVSAFFPKLKFSETAYAVAVTGTSGVGTLELGNMFVLVAEDTTPVWQNYYPFTAATAYWIDSKIDDGLPRSGMVRDRYPSNSVYVADTLPCGVANRGCDLSNCNTVNQYDILGTLDATTHAAELSGNRPDRLDCSIAIGRAW